MTFGPPHPFVGDIVATLTAPNGTVHSIFGRTLATTATGFGDSSDLAGPYVFSDNAPMPPNGGWWQAATAAGTAVAIPSGTYRTTASGGAGATNPMPPTSMNAAFAGVTNPNGTWTLTLRDGCNADTGAISAASLTIESAAPSSANADFNGDGRTDWAIARASASLADFGITPRPGQLGYSASDERPSPTTESRSNDVPQGAPIEWWVQFNGAAGQVVRQLGDAGTDFIVPEDYDGDGIDDVAVWTEAPSTQAQFKVLQSSTATVVFHTFGQTGDDPAVVGDYDGDGKSDVAVFRCPPFSGADGQCFFFYRGTLNNPSGNITYVPWGFGVEGDFFPLVGDFDGDGKNDFCIQGANPANPSKGLFYLRRSSDAGVEYINWGLSSDFLIPGDYDGDGKDDICVRRTESGQRVHYVLLRTGGSNRVQFGITGDISVPGDYDGDGKTDIAVWRGSTNATTNYFWVLNSSGSSVSLFEWGQCPTVTSCDFPVASWAVH